MEFKDKGEFIEVWGWDAFRGNDDCLFGAIRKGEDGYHWFHPARRAVMSFRMMRDIAKKLSELNT
jgi:hypothetical protein